MLGRNSTATTRTTSTGASSGVGNDPMLSAPASYHPKQKRSLKNRFGLQRLHPDHTNPALRTKINDPRVSGAEAKEAQVALADRGEAVPKRSLGTKLKRLSNRWRGSGAATSKTTPKTY